MIGIFIAYKTNDDPTERLQTAWQIQTDGVYENECSFNGSSYAFTIGESVTFANASASITQRSYVASKMCITSGASTQAYPDESTVILMMVLFIGQIFIIPMVQIPNLIHTSSFISRCLTKNKKENSKGLDCWYNQKIQCHANIQSDTHLTVKDIKEQIRETLSQAGSLHGSNLTVAGFVVMWTFLANVGFVYLQVMVPIACMFHYKYLCNLETDNDMYLCYNLTIRCCGYFIINDVLVL